MQIFKLIHLLFFLGFVSPSILCQSINDRELGQLADNLSKEVESRMSDQNIAIADFVDIDDKPSKLGKYLAEEFGYTLVNSATNFKVIDRTQLRRLMEEAGIGDKGMVDPKSVQKLGRLEGITAVVYGKLIPAGNQVKVYVKVVVLENQVNEINIRGEITRTVTIDQLLEDEKEKSDLEEGKSSSSKKNQNLPASTYSNQNIRIDLKGCSPNGNSIDCQLQITSVNRSDIFNLKAANTWLYDLAGNKYYASHLFMGNNDSSVIVNSPLNPNSPVTAFVRFSGIPINTKSFSALQVECTSNVAFSFLAQLRNISLQP